MKAPKYEFGAEHVLGKVFNVTPTVFGYQTSSSGVEVDIGQENDDDRHVRIGMAVQLVNHHDAKQLSKFFAELADRLVD